MLFEGREHQFKQAQQTNARWIFFSIEGCQMFMLIWSTVKSHILIFLKKKAEIIDMTSFFLFKPWSAIYISDNERYENFEESKAIDRCLQHTYQELGYSLIEVPYGTVKERCNFMINWLKTYT